MKLQIDEQRLHSELETLATFSDAEPPAVTRIVFIPEDLNARAWVIAQCEEARLAVLQDAIGNIVARWVGADPAAPAFRARSHIDGIPARGHAEWALGVI